MTYLVVEADGGSRGNPGIAGYGALVRDTSTGAVLAERAAPLGRASNNVAEYTGLIEGLRAAEELSPCAHVEVRMDSKLVVEQMSGRWKIKHADMRRLAGEAREVASRIKAEGGSVTYTWIPREGNHAADALSNKGMDGETIRRTGAAPEPQNKTIPEPAVSADITASDSGSGEVRARQGEPAGVRPEKPSATASPSQPADLGAPTRVVIVRHGLTDDNIAGRVTGRGGHDAALNAEGAHQARRTAAAIADAVGEGEVYVVSSSLARAQQTAAVIASRLGVELAVDSAWDEQSVGEWDGLTWTQIAEKDSGAPGAARSDEQFSAPGGESFVQLRRRVARAWESVASGDRAVVVVTHRGPVDAVLTELLGISRAMAARLGASPGSLMWLRVWTDRGFMIDRLNDDAHLR